MAGLPANTNREIETSVNLVRRLHATLDAGLALFANAVETQERTRRELEQLISNGRHRLGYYETERELNQLTHGMAMINSDTVAGLHNFAAFVTTTLETINSMKADVAGVVQAPIIFTSKSEDMDKAHRANEMTERGTENVSKHRVLNDGGPFDSVRG